VAVSKGPAFRWFERTLLGMGMTVMAFVIERRLLKAIKRGDANAAPRTAEHPPADATTRISASAHGSEARG
jgi:hypothetical protein